MKNLVNQIRQDKNNFLTDDEKQAMKKEIAKKNKIVESKRTIRK